ncbi:MAG: hypothetical protein KAY37_09585 [Phycisphaerae bacterium]|nr:hypothetical protein [Phycisphaerae bacterium]
MALNCPRCKTSNVDAANYCCHCGLPLAEAAAGVVDAGRTPHPEPLKPPEGFEPIESAAQLYFHWEPAGGGTLLLGTETLGLSVYNGGYDLAEVALQVRGEDQNGKELFAVECEIEEWPRGRTEYHEIPSWELPDPVHALHVELVKAEFGLSE